MNDKEFTKALLAAQPALTAYSRKLTRHKERAEDLLQDGNCKLWEKRTKYEEGNFLGWCKTVIKNTYLNQVAIEARMKFTDDAFATGLFQISDDHNGDGSGHNSAMEARYLSSPPNQEDVWLENKIMEAIATFEPYKALLIQKKLQGMDYKQIAKALGITPNNAKQRYFNVAKELRQLLDSQGLLDN